jgi:glucosamine--fructose-6-phosphate aminotransferase (isomerizing)
MCGIVGVVGYKSAPELLIAGLRQLEYRGYDSVGISVFKQGEIKTLKTKGRIDNIALKLEQNPLTDAYVGIGHTRWATHGEPSDINSHPHGNHRISLVHNGIIENYLQIKERMIRKGYTFESQTDTEALAKLVDYYYVQKGNPLDAIKKVLEKIRGSYALGILFEGHPDTIYAIRKDSPLIIGLGKDENFIASDITAILDHTREYYLLEEDEIAIIKQDSVTILDHDFEEIHKEVQVASWDRQSAEKAGYPHFMLKEIHEQPTVLMNAVGPRIKNHAIDFSESGLTNDVLKGITKFHLIACGTAMHAAMVGKQLIEKHARVSCDVEVASEFRYRDPILNASDMVIIVSQSGETADSLAALRLAKSRGTKVIAIVNVVGSSIAREADYVLYTWAGLEIAVASTKAYFVQVALFTLLAYKLGEVKGFVSTEQTLDLLDSLLKLPAITQELLDKQETIKQMASEFVNNRNVFFLGRGLDYAMALEASLKLKEISYIHSEAYPAGELKHGTISLIVEDFPVIALVTQAALVEKMVSNIKEVKARGAKVILIGRPGLDHTHDFSDREFILPEVHEDLMPLVSIIPLQLFAYYSSVLRGLDVDKPRNLAKSVTVE